MVYFSPDLASVKWYSNRSHAKRGKLGSDVEKTAMHTELRIMKKIVGCFIFLAAVGTVLLGALLYKRWIPGGFTILNLSAVLGAFYTFLALAFAFCAASWARTSVNLALAYFRDYFGLPPEEREIFVRFASDSKGGKKRLSKESFLEKVADLRDAAYYLKRLTEKDWIKESKGKLFLSTEKHILAEQLKGNSDGQ